MTKAKQTKATALAKFDFDHAYGDYDRAREPVAAQALAPIAPRVRERYSRGPFYLKIAGLEGPRPTSEELNAGKGWK